MDILVRASSSIRSYRHLTLYSALWCEMDKRDVDRTRQIYTEVLKLIPHKKFTFAKVWVMKAQFDLRQSQLQAARKTMGQAIGMCPKGKIFKNYIEMELKLFEFVRCRTLYEKMLEFNPSSTSAWIKYAELERGLDDLERVRAIFELAISQHVLDMPELLWKAYIDFEEEESEYTRVRALYERLLDKTDHVKVWISYAHFEINVPDSDQENDEEEEDDEETSRPISTDAKLRARAIFDRAYKSMREKNLKEERVALLNAYLSFERTHGGEEDIERVEKQMPRKVKKRRRLDDDSFEEYMDYVFPADDESAAKISRLLAMAQEWKKGQGQGGV